MYAGRIVESGPVDTLYHEPGHPYTRLLFAATPDLDGSNQVASIPGAPPRLDAPLAGCPFRPRCDRAIEVCETVDPETRPLGERHEAACHRAETVAGSAVAN
jgi:oligopeptide/dipeptide ABC transporter ATP-binding protein